MESLAQVFDNFSEKTIEKHPFFFCFDCIEPIHTDRPFQCKNVILPSAFFLYIKSGRITLEIHSRDNASEEREKKVSGYKKTMSPSVNSFVWDALSRE